MCAWVAVPNTWLLHTRTDWLVSLLQVAVADDPMRSETPLMLLRTSICGEWVLSSSL